MTTYAEAMRALGRCNDGRGRVVRSDDKRLGKHTPERRAAIMAGMKRTEEAHEQRRIALAGQPHRFTPWNPGKPAPFTLAYGGCWACWWGQNVGKSQNYMTSLGPLDVNELVEHIEPPLAARGKVV